MTAHSNSGKAKMSNDLKNKFDDFKSLLEDLRERVREQIESFCTKHNYLFEDRIKSPASLIEKLESGRYRQWSDIDDLYGATVIIPTKSHEQGVSDFLQEVFVLDSQRSSSKTNKPPDVFRFDSPRFYLKLKPDPQFGVEQRSIHAFIFEVQIKTVFEYAWSRTTHDLAYKAPVIDWKVQRLAALLKAQVEQIDIIVSAFNNTAEVIPESPYTSMDVKREIFIHLSSAIESGKIPTELQPSSWVRFVDNIYKLIEIWSKKPPYLEHAGIPYYRQALDLFDSYLDQEEIPRSLTLFQTFVGILFSEDNLIHKKNIKAYSPVIDPRIKDFFKDFKDIVPPFEID